MLLPPGTIPCCPLCSAGFHQFPHYYEAVRLLSGRQGLSVCKTSIPLTTLWSLPDLPGMQVLPLCARHALLTPTESPQPRVFGWFLLPATLRTVSASALYYFTGLHRFTVSHCGSRTPLPTLKPHLTASAPRLSTGCSLRFTGSGLSPDYITCTVLAHPRAHCSPFRTKRQRWIKIRLPAKLCQKELILWT